MRIKLNFTVMKSYIEEHQNIWQLQSQTVWLLLLVIQNGKIFNNTEGVSMSNDGTLTVSDSTNDYIAAVKVFGENKNLLEKIRLLSVN